MSSIAFNAQVYSKLNIVVASLLVTLFFLLNSVFITPLYADTRGLVKIKDVPIKIGLKKFYRALSDLVSKRRKEPVKILHLGDERIARDRFSGDLREMLQGRFGNSGRGMVMPGPVVPFYRARGVSLKKSGKWKVLTAVSGKKSAFGLTGASLSSSDPRASLTLTAQDKVSWVEVSFMSAPKMGRALLQIEVSGKVHRHVIETQSSKVKIQRIRIPTLVSSVKVSPHARKPIVVLSWRSGYDRPGVRYINLGLPRATADLATNLDAEFVKQDLDTIRPDLIVLGYGTNEGFNKTLDLAAYQRRFANLLHALNRLAPYASLLVIGPPDVGYLPSYARGGTAVASKACKALDRNERKNYARLIASRHPNLARWYPPLKLNSVRLILRRVAAASGAYYWDWSSVMGGACGIHAWVHSKPKLAADNHRSLTNLGAKQSAHRLYAEIMTGFESYHLAKR